jgi:hypothetical protein
VRNPRSSPRGGAPPVGMGISFKLSKVGVRVHPAARPASAAPAQAEKTAAAEAEGSVSDSRGEVRCSVPSVSCGAGVSVSLRDGLGGNDGVGDLDA